jgi:hypothetical protein
MKTVFLSVAVMATIILGACTKLADSPVRKPIKFSEQKSNLWFANSQNHREAAVFNALAVSFDYANAEGQKFYCGNNKESAVLNWFHNFDEKYHGLHSFSLDPALLTEDSLSQAWADKLIAAYFINSPTSSIDSIFSLEKKLINEYPVHFPNQNLEFEGLLELSSKLKMVKHLFSNESYNICESITYNLFEDMFLGLSDDPYDDCMRRKINNAGLFEIIINYGAGPGGWVAVASADCVVEILMSE